MKITLITSHTIYGSKRKPTSLFCSSEVEGLSLHLFKFMCCSWVKFPVSSCSRSIGAVITLKQLLIAVCNHVDSQVPFPSCSEVTWHSEQTKGLAPVWVSWCLARSCLVAVLFSHKSHWNLLMSLCVRMCLVRLLFILKFFWHSSHWYGFSPLCVLVWCTRCNVIYLVPDSHTDYTHGLQLSLISHLVTSFFSHCFELLSYE